MGKIEFIQEPNSDKEIFDSLNPVMAKWFKQKFGKERYYDDRKKESPTDKLKRT